MLGRTRSTTRALLLIVLAVSCSESENPAPPANELAERLVGDYTARSDSAGGMTYWMRFGSDAKRTALTERDNGIRGIAEDDWVVVDDASGAVRINGLDVVASFSQGDSVLTFSPTGPEGIAVYERSGAMPDPQTWVSEIQLLAEFDLPEVGLTDLAWDGTGIWFPGGVLGSLLQRMNPAMDLEIDVSLTAAHSGNAVAYTSKGFWVDDGLQRRLYQLDETGSTRLATNLVPLEDIHGISTLPAETAWLSAGTSVYLWNTIEGGIDTVELYQSVEGLESVGPDMFVALGAAGITRLEGPPWRAEETYVLAGVDVHGLAFDGSSWWLTASDRRAEPAVRVFHAALLPPEARSR
jgi:hypothetical protein